MISLSAFSRLRHDNKGLSFIGMVLIVLTISVFTAALFIAIPSSDATRKLQTTMEKGATLGAGIKKYKLHNAGAAPAQLDDLVTTTAVPCVIDNVPSSSTYKQLTGWCGPYLDQPLNSGASMFQTDGWGVLFQYDGVTLKSCGPDLTCGNADDITFDI